MSQLSFGSSSSNISPYLENQYQSQYQNALQLNANNYQNILSNYGANQSNIGAGTAGVAAGYGNLSNQVQGTIAGIGASQSQAIKDVYAQQSGELGQSLINSGLGNTTVSSQLQRGPMLDAQKAQVALSNQLAQLSAGYQAQLGGAGLQAQLQGTGLQAQAGNVLGGNLASYRTPYPNQPPLTSQSAQQSGGYGGARGGSGAGVGSNGLWSAGSSPSYGGSLGGGSQVMNPFSGGGQDPMAQYLAQYGTPQSQAAYGDANYGIGAGDTPTVGPTGGGMSDSSLSGDLGGYGGNAGYGAGTYGMDAYSGDFGY